MKPLIALLIGVLFFIIAHTLVWLQFNGQFVWNFFKENRMLTGLLLAVPMSLLFTYGASHLNVYLNSLWSMKLVGSGIGIGVFFFMSWLIAGELPSLKNLICIVLSISIMLIQILWR